MDISEITSSPWTWDTDEAFRPTYWVTASDDGISYTVHMMGPAGGFGMAGYQSYEELLARGPINDMPAEIEKKVRAHAEQMIRAATRTRLRWELTVSPQGLPPGEELAYVSAAINEETIVVKALDADTTILFDGSRCDRRATLAILVGFGRPWRRPGVRTSEDSFAIDVAPGASATVTTIVQPDFSIVSRRGDR